MFPTISRCFSTRIRPGTALRCQTTAKCGASPGPRAGRRPGSPVGQRCTVSDRLEKRVYLEDDTLHLKYQAENLSPSDMHYIWAAHPLFNASPGMEIIVPEGMNRIVNSVPSRRLGPYGRVYDFPAAGLEGGAVSTSHASPKHTVPTTRSTGSSAELRRAGACSTTRSSG